eukprot:CAMPEP_0201981864 /NCGR_PEP_ID=MMETSP0904-20121228/75002_1 /ASSEMBLY_ACC=CAM_ASM_000553 /TAXON_ID=420261 /ORGANISM="Thalassiosira antarctica, Strain CCMP982" /LENGTH=105 /DNA_ID=CAMNT_0048534525 /DNA_START=577 /DNA_END=894 /DNA_ORIENTATION=+
MTLHGGGGRFSLLGDDIPEEVDPAAAAASSPLAPASGFLGKGLTTTFSFSTSRAATSSASFTFRSVMTRSLASFSRICATSSSRGRRKKNTSGISDLTPAIILVE